MLYLFYLVFDNIQTIVMNIPNLSFENHLKPKDLSMMNSLKSSIFMLAMGLSLGAVSADIDRSTESDDFDRSQIDRSTESDSTNGISQSETIKMRDCNDKSGPAEVECKQAIKNDRAGTLPNQNSRIIRNKNRQIRENIKSNEVNPNKIVPGN